MNDFIPNVTQRLKSIDALRGLAVLLMIEQHLGIWLWKEHYKLFDHIFMLCFNGLGGFSAPVFITIAGLGCSFLQYRHDNTDRTLISRGLVIIFFGYLLNILTPSWFSIGSWYVLHMIGFAMILSPLLRRLPSHVLILLFFAVLIATVCIQNALDTPPKISSRHMGNINLPGGVFRLALAEGHFPVFPWLSLFLAGILTGRWLINKKLQNILCMALACLCTGMLLSAFNLLGFEFATEGPLLRACKILPRFYPAFPPIILILVALVLFSVLIITLIESKRGFSPINPLVCLGRSSLTLLIIHVVIFRQLSHYFQFWRIFSIGETLSIVFVILTLSAVLAVLWRKFNYRFGAEWLLRKIAG